MFNGLPVDRTEDTSTNNLPRKLKKLKKKQLLNFLDEREKEIKRLEDILNPPKTTNRKKKKKNNKDKNITDDELLDKAIKEKKYLEEIFKKDEEERLKKEKEEQERQRKIREEQERVKRKEEQERYQKEKERIEREERKRREREKRKRREKEEKERRDRKLRKLSEIKDKFKLSHIPKDIEKFVFKPDRKEYKKLALKYHPDKGGNAEHFKILNYYMN
jgi:hypothetical protein